ncbi:tyrosine-protein phosphatase non-receptor type 11-like isoform X1 [Rhopilema esculentum]|uniref:tyrosine-protein phosphatase non-receptor type 11-like isoform X1 n=2 Tax=Rhopilema esculentum TaxID=499914 RepID=UPI0031D3A933
MEISGEASSGELVMHLGEKGHAGFSTPQQGLALDVWQMSSGDPKMMWFHPHINPQESDDLLKGNGTDGTFLVRPSQSHQGNFTISVLHQNEVTNIKVLNDGDCFQLASLDGAASEPFATLNDLVNHCMKTKNAIPLKDGGCIEMKYPLASQDPTSERWFHGPLKGAEAEKLLLSKGTVGNFLVRESQSQPGQFVISARCQSGVSHVIVKNRNGKFDVGSGLQFNSLALLVDYYRQNPQLRDANTQTDIKLVEPFYSTSFIARNIGERMQQLEKKIHPRLDGFGEEFERLQYFDMKQGAYSTREGMRPENKTKNRYKNILPYDHSRVKLQGAEPRVVGSDYINANYVDSELKETQTSYIAAQGCLPATRAAFWSMIYQENCRIIVMLTNEVERGKAKCARYWPDAGQSNEYDDIVIDNMMESHKGDFLVRELRLYKKNEADKEPRMIYQYHFTAWPDHGTPDEPTAVLDLLDDIYAQYLRCHRVGPILFHCSAGIGRTGTVIVIDVLIHLLEEQGIDSDIDIQKTTQLIRSKRPGMIQTQHQYRFVYRAIQKHLERFMAEQNSSKVTSSSGIYENVQTAVVGKRQAGNPRSRGNVSDKSLLHSNGDQAEYKRKGKR